MSTAPAEEFKPIPIRRDAGMLGRLAFAARMMVDLQLLTCKQFLMPHLAVMKGNVLDVGCGEMPFRGLLPEATRYTGLDGPAAGDFGMGRHPEIMDFDGVTIPFPDASQDHILCTEVLEHVPNPETALAEIRRVLRPGGVLIGSVPARSLIWRLRFLSSTCPHSEPFHNEYLPDEVRELLKDWQLHVFRYSLLHFSLLFVAS